MRGAGRISAAYSKLEDQQRAHEARDEQLKEMKERQDKRELELEQSISHNDDQLSITNERKNILEKISK